MSDDRITIHTDSRPITEQQIEVMFTKARAAIALGQHFTLEYGPRLTITVTADRQVITEAHYAGQLRLATLEENRAGVASARDALAYEDAYAAHVVESLHEMRARRQTLAEMDAQLEGEGL